MKCFYPPYEGEKPYIFFSYCHKDAAIDFPMIERLIMEGYRVWYDDGIQPGDDWPEVIAEHLKNSTICLAAISKQSVSSHNCKNEMNYAISNNKPLLTVILEKFNMSQGICLQISSSQFLNRYEYTDSLDTFYARLVSASCLEPCKGENVQLSVDSLREWRNRSEEYPGLVTKEIPPKKDPLVNVPPEKDSPVNVPPEKDPPVNVPPEKGPSANVPSEKNAPANVPLDKDPSAKLPPVKPSTPPDDDLTIIEQGDDVTIVEESAKTVFAYLIRQSNGKIYRLTRHENILGRSVDHANIVIEDKTSRISRHHADLYCMDGKIFLKDNASRNGTFYKNNRLGTEAQELQSFDVFNLHTEELLIVSHKDEAIMRAAKSLGVLAFLTSEETGEIKVLTDELLLDRSHPWRSGPLSKKNVSREKQCRIYERDGQYILVDMVKDTPKNPSFLNGIILQQGKEHVLHSGDRFEIAHNAFLFTRIELEKA